MKKVILLFSAFLLASVFSTVFANTSKTTDSWPPAGDATIYEWRLSTNDAPFVASYLQIVFDQDGFYQCMEEDGAPAYSDGWGPHTTWAVPHWEKVADGRLWETNLGVIAFGEYFVYGDAVYQCTNPEGTESWGDEGWGPTGWNSTSYTKICDADLVPKTDPGEVNVLPDNYVGYWYDNDLAWLKGWIGINWELHTVHQCIANAHANGGETPGGQGTSWGYWTASLGEEKDLLSIEGVTIPTWDDERSWPLGAIVQLGGKYYTCLADTHKDGGEIPGGDGSTWGYWTDLNLYGSATGLQTISAGTFTYSVQNGSLVVNSRENVNIQLYDLAGQLIATSASKSIELPQKGTYIAKVNVGGKTTSIKVLK